MIIHRYRYVQERMFTARSLIFSNRLAWLKTLLGQLLLKPTMECPEAAGGRLRKGLSNWKLNRKNH
jgi:hypothetical protein